MEVARSRLTRQGQISVPAAIRRRLGIAPGNSIEWIEHQGQVIVRRSGHYTFLEAHQTLFPDGPPAKATLEDLKEGIRQYIRNRHAGR
jgi:AbrB family looped-hinge helix DNA binding protein